MSKKTTILPQVTVFLVLAVAVLIGFLFLNRQSLISQEAPLSYEEQYEQSVKTLDDNTDLNQVDDSLKQIGSDAATF